MDIKKYVNDLKIHIENGDLEAITRWVAEEINN